MAVKPLGPYISQESKHMEVPISYLGIAKIGVIEESPESSMGLSLFVGIL
jgi:hypothetical protein